MATQAELVLKIRRKLYELNAGRFTDPMLREWLNEACDDAARRTQSLRANDTIAVVSGTQMYLAPDDLISLNAVMYQATGNTSSYDLDYKDYKSATAVSWAGLTNSQGTPEIYWTWGFPPLLEIHLYPIPSQAGTLTLHYYKRFEPLATESGADANTEVAFPPGWEDMLVDYVVAEGFLTDRDQRHEVYRQRYEGKLSGYVETSTRFNDQAGSIDVAGSLVPAWLYDFDY